MTGLSSPVWFTWLLALWPHRMEPGWVPDLKGTQECQRWYPFKTFNQEALRTQWVCGSHGASRSRGDGFFISTKQRPMSTNVMEEQGLWVRKENHLPPSQSLQEEIGTMSQRKTGCEGQSEPQAAAAGGFLEAQIHLWNFVSMTFFGALLINPHFTRASTQL